MNLGGIDRILQRDRPISDPPAAVYQAAHGDGQINIGTVVAGIVNGDIRQLERRLRRGVFTADFTSDNRLLQLQP